MNRPFAILLMTVAMAVGPAARADLSVFGLQFGAPVALPECPYKSLSNGTRLHDIISPFTCTWPAAVDRNHNLPAKRLVFSERETPSIVKNWQAQLLEINGKLAGMTFLTAGANTQEFVLSQLIEKFGPASSLRSIPYATTHGLQIQAIEAEWDRPDVKVRFDGVEDRIDFGRVFIDTPAAAELRRSWRADDRKERRPL